MFEPAISRLAVFGAEPVADFAFEPIHHGLMRVRPKVPALVVVRDMAGSQDGFQIPSGIWSAMIACYGTFFFAIAAATAWSGHARFALTISVLYTAMYFGVARILAAVGGPEKPSPLLRRDGVLQTWTGPMDRHAVAAQILAVPFGLALFGIGIALIRLAVG